MKTTCVTVPMRGLGFIIVPNNKKLGLYAAVSHIYEYNISVYGAMDHVGETPDCFKVMPKIGEEVSIHLI